MKNIFYALLVIIFLSAACEHDTVAPNEADNTENTSDNDTTSTSNDDDDDDSDTTSTSGSDTTSTGGSDTTTVDVISYANDIQPILNQNCAYSGCHNSATKADGYDFSSYTTTKKAVSAGSATNSKLYKVINTTGKDRMPPAPLDRLVTDEIQMIATWINDGAANN